MQPYNSGRMLIHGHGPDEKQYVCSTVAHCTGLWVLVLQISMCVLHVLLLLASALLKISLGLSVLLRSPPGLSDCALVDRRACKHIARCRARLCVIMRVQALSGR